MDIRDKLKQEKKKNDNIEDDEEIELLNKKMGIITDALEYYDKFQEKYRDEYININYISLEISDKDLDHNVIIFYNTNLKELFRSRYERIGILDLKSQIWTWAWARPDLRKNETNIIRKILFYGTELDPSMNYLKTELITSRFKITNKTQLDIFCAISGYLSKKPKIFNYKIYGNPKIIDNKYVDILHPDINKNEDTYELISYIFLLD
jgi:hypothetical protein